MRISAGVAVGGRERRVKASWSERGEVWSFCDGEAGAMLAK